MQQLGGASRARFFPVDVTDTDTIAAAAKGTASWVAETGAPLAGIIPAAGVGFPGLVRLTPLFFFSFLLFLGLS